MRSLNEIIVHCTATRPDWWATRSTAQKVAEVRRWHVGERGWSDIGYHFLIDRNGNTVEGRALGQVGAHTQGRNAGTIGVALFGGHGSAANDKFEDNYTPEQDKALQALLKKLRADYPTITVVSGHNQYAAKACPGFNVPSWYAKARPQPAPVASKAGFFAALAAFLGRLK
jgi:N-acetylmuramoyl-L-alanine amidase